MKPVAIPQVQFLYKVYMPVVSCVRCFSSDNAENCGDSAVAVLRRGRAHFLSWCRGRFPWSCSSADHGDSPVAVLERGDRRPCCAGRAASQVWSQLQFLDTLVTCPLLSTTGAWGLTVPLNCGGPAVAVLRRCRIPVVVQRPIPMVFLLGRPWRLCSCSFFPGGRCPRCAGRVRRFRLQR